MQYFMSVVTIFATIILFSLFKLFYTILWIPYKIQHHFKKQGVEGPGYVPFTGNSPEIRRMREEKGSRVLKPGDHKFLDKITPAHTRWSNMYGKVYLYWFGTKPILALTDLGLIKEVFMKTGGAFERPESDPLSKQLLGDGLNELRINGERWAVHRRISSLALNMDQAKGWVPKMVDSVKSMFKKWEAMGDDGRDEPFEIEAHKEFHELFADMISRTIFGSSFEQGKRVFQLQEQQMSQHFVSMNSFYIPGFRFLPTKNNRKRWKLVKEIRETIRKLILESNRETSRNLISMLMSSSKNKDCKEEKLDIEEVIEECRTFYFAGKHTSSDFTTWAIVLLAMHQDWQVKAREEVIRVCNNEFPSSDDLSELKIINMILNETFRLYSVVIMLMRETCQSITLGNINIPANIEIGILMTASNRDRQVWGEDADEFNPERFSEAGKNSGLFFPWGFGRRICVGQHLAIVELKIVLAMILRRYSFELSPTYVHAPEQFLTLQPQFGAQILFRRISA